MSEELNLEDPMIDLDSLLARSDPAFRYAADTQKTDDLIARMAIGSRNEKTARRRAAWWKRPQIVIPIAFGAALLTTAGAIFIPFTYDYFGKKIDPDVIIPIHYTTDTGVTVDCQYGIYVGNPKSRSAAETALAGYFHTKDWSGIGQEIYRQAMAHPFIPGPNDHIDNDTLKVRDTFSFSHALDTVIYDQIPTGLLTHSVTRTGGESNCTGQLR
jgi:hypothetical protein